MPRRSICHEHRNPLSRILPRNLNLSRMESLENVRLATYWEDLQQQPGHQAAISKADPMAPEL